MDVRANYEMTVEDLSEILEACKPVPMIMLNIMNNCSSRQENANRAWKRLGDKMGFDGDTARPIEGKGSRFFSAVPSETIRKAGVLMPADEKLLDMEIEASTLSVRVTKCMTVTN